MEPNLIFPNLWPLNPRGYLVQKTLRGCTANMGSKIRLLVYEWPLIKCKIWYMNGLIFQKFPKFKKILEKLGNFAQNLAKNWTDWYMNGSVFLEKLVFVWVYFQILWQHILTKTKLEYPPGPLTTGQMKRSPWALFMVDLNQHIDIVSFVEKRLFKIWPFNSDPNDPKMTSDQKLLNTLKEPLAKNLFTQVSSKSIELCRQKSILSIFEWPKITPRRPSTANSWHPYCSPWWSLYPSITKIHQGIFVKHFLIVHTKIDRCISMPLYPT